ncbi:hypothetical protein QBC33DRAFT_574679 [Phialemonium atrogriseum]|uniref:Zn(2)-C6 fungal-type domain-containing protein n=1 Tax=Phialemonium atrogriseum TaxID=1093897 RepID=A0AAJ0BNZ1_9PEZI|nr:uncharacterized protein QBC33DRAFT_574679 [Phialemonium atrogriseum]KAK1761799.1 hypothetical protein QBC33DRAFT_574679 [Phialemonium atrogriseum]
MMMSTPSPSASSTAAHKQGHHDAGNSAPAPVAVPKRRAPKACRACRMRKVRCNVFEHGPPCTNCRLDDVDCAVPQRRKGRSHPNTRKVQRSPQTEALFTEPGLMEWENDEQILSTSSNNDAAVRQTVIVGGNPEDDTSAQRAPERPRQIEATADAIPEASTLVLEQAFSRPPAGSIELPYFIRPLPSNIDPVDLEYLQRRGTFRLPEKPLVEELLWNYFEMIHPFTPIVDRDVISQLFEFQITTNGGEDARLSLFLMQAMLFVASAFVKESFLQEGGYGIRADLRREFYLRAKALYDFDLETDPVASLQGLLILTYWFSPEQPKNGWFWLEAAISKAQLMDLSAMVERCQQGRRKSLLKRLWWCCFIKENATHLELRKIPRLRLETCDVEPLALADFGIEEDGHEEAGQASQRQGFLVLARSDAFRTSNFMIVSKERAIIIETKACEAQLRQWRDTLHPEAQWREPQDNVEVDSSVEMHKILMHLMYFAAMSTLYQAQGFPLTAQAPTDPEQLRFHELSKQRVCYSAGEITKLAEAARRYQVTPYMPDFTLALLVPAIVVHLRRLRARQPECRQEGYRGLRICIELVESLKQSCAAAHRVVRLLTPALEKSGCSLTAASPLSRQRSATAAAAATAEAKDGPTTTTTLTDFPSFTITTPSPLPPFLDAPLSPVSPAAISGAPQNENEKRPGCPTTTTIITPPASLGQPMPTFWFDSLTLDMDTMSADSTNPLGATQPLEQPPLAMYAFDSADTADLFASLDDIDWSVDSLFSNLNSPIPNSIDCPLDMDGFG